MTKSNTALAVQVGGDHYKSCAIQPVQFIEANGLGFLEGCVVKRLARHGKPTGKGRQDIEKAIHELQLLLELRYPAAVANDNAAPCKGCTDIVCLKAGKCGGNAGTLTGTLTVPMTAEMLKVLNARIPSPHCTRSGDPKRSLCGECAPFGTCAGI